MTYRGRYAPSPTGLLHIGNAFTAFVAWQRARRAHGALVLRVEDLDRARNVAGMIEAQVEDLRWLGIDWDEGPVLQSARTALYAAAVERLLDRGHAYYCTCSRKTIAALASAPHGPEDDGPRYPGTCRGRRDKPVGRYAVRFLAKGGLITVDDALQGVFTQDVAETVGDFVIARADGVFAYQLAVVVDDIDMRVSEVVRGADLLTSTPRQILLYDALGAVPPRFAHTPLVVASRGSDAGAGAAEKLSKRTPRHTLQGLREAGVSAETLRARFAASADGEGRATIALDELLR